MAITHLCFSVLLSFAASAEVHAPRDARALFLAGKRKEAGSALRARGGADAERRGRILAEQFVTAENFQRYQDMKDLAEAELWPECLKVAERVTAEDKTNLLVLRAQAHCNLRQGKASEAQSAYQAALELDPREPDALMGLSLLALEQKHPEEAARILEPLVKNQPKNGAELERLALLRAEIALEGGRLDDAIALLQSHHERHIDHVETFYRLAELFQKKKGAEWMSRRTYAQFIVRYRKLPEGDVRRRRLANQFNEAQAKLATLDKKLEVMPRTTP